MVAILHSGRWVNENEFREVPFFIRDTYYGLYDLYSWP